MTGVLEIIPKKLVKVQTSGENELIGATLRAKNIPLSHDFCQWPLLHPLSHHPSHAVCQPGLLWTCF